MRMKFSVHTGDGSGAMSTIAIVIFVAIGLVLLMRLNDREDTPSVGGSSLAAYIVAVGVLLGITVLFVRGCQGSF